MTFLSTVIIVHSLILLSFFSEHCNQSIFIYNLQLILQKKNKPTVIISSPREHTFNFFLANRSFLSISQPFWKWGQTSDTKHSSQRSIWLRGEFRHQGGSSGHRQLVTSLAHQNDYVYLLDPLTQEQIQPGFEKCSQAGFVLSKQAHI